MILYSKLILISDGTHLQVAWPLIANFTCASAVGCTTATNKGWRYFLYTMGGFTLLLFFIRFFIFRMYESPKYLMGRGRDKEAVEVVHRVAKYNGTTSTLTLESLQAAGADARWAGDSASVVVGEIDTSARGAVRRHLSKLRTEHLKSLFATKKLAWSTSLLITCWGKFGIQCMSSHLAHNYSKILALIGLAFPL